MNPVFRLTQCALAAAMLTLAVSSHALTLGRARGAAMVAQPFQVTIAVSAAADEDVSDLCFDADVFYGESKVEGGRVTVSTDPASAGQTWNVRIGSRLPVDEPVVTVYLRSTCTAKAARRYVFLADVASDNLTAAPVLPVVAASIAASTSAAKQPTAGGKDTSSASQTPPASASASNAKQSRSRTAVEKATAQPGKELLGRNTKLTSKSRLKLDTLDLSAPRDPVLRSTLELLSTPTQDSQKRGEAIALWRALNLTPEDVMRDAARLQSVEDIVRELTNVSKSNQRQVQELKVALEQSERDRYNNPVVWGLGGALLLLLAGGVWLLRRQPQTAHSGSAWWRPAADSELAPDLSLDAYQDAPRADITLPIAEQGHKVSARAPLSDVDIDLQLDFDMPPAALSGVGDSPSEPAAPEELGVKTLPRPAGLRDFSLSMSGSLRSMNTQEMLDIRQQAEFFMTLGQYEDAITLLEGHIADAADANPAVYLDLLKILHTLSRKDSFDKYRAEFNAIFTGQVADYKDFVKPGQGLETYPELCVHLSKLWPSHEALGFMEDCMVRKPHAAANMLFELEAFKDLLMLHGVATRLVDALDGTPVSFSASKPVWPAASVFHTGPSPLDVSLPASMTAPTEVDLELDIPEDTSEVSTSAPMDNLIDFDASGLSYKISPDKRPT